MPARCMENGWEEHHKGWWHPRTVAAAYRYDWSWIFQHFLKHIIRIRLIEHLGSVTVTVSQSTWQIMTMTFFSQGASSWIAVCKPVRCRFRFSLNRRWVSLSLMNKSILWTECMKLSSWVNAKQSELQQQQQAIESDIFSKHFTSSMLTRCNSSFQNTRLWKITSSSTSLITSIGCAGSPASAPHAMRIVREGQFPPNAWPPPRCTLHQTAAVPQWISNQTMTVQLQMKPAEMISPVIDIQNFEMHEWFKLRQAAAFLSCSMDISSSPDHSASGCLLW